MARKNTASSVLAKRTTAKAKKVAPSTAKTQKKLQPIARGVKPKREAVAVVHLNPIQKGISTIFTKAGRRYSIGSIAFVEDAARKILQRISGNLPNIVSVEVSDLVCAIEKDPVLTKVFLSMGVSPGSIARNKTHLRAMNVWNKCEN